MDNDLKNLVFIYFPKNLGDQSYVDSAVEESQEFQSLQRLISGSDHFKERSILSQIGKEAGQKKLSFLLCDRQSLVYKRSLGARFRLFVKIKNEQKIYTDLILALSLLAPVYFFEVIKTKTQHGVILEESVLHEFVIPTEYDFVPELLKAWGYSLIPKFVLEKPIPEISFFEIEKGKFDYFNAFFGNTIGDLMY